MPTWTLGIIIGSLLVVALLAYGLLKVLAELKHLRAGREPDPAVLLLQRQLEGLRDQTRASLEGLTAQLNQRLQESTALLQQVQMHIGERLDRAAQVVGEVHGRLGKLDEATRRMLELGQDIAGLQQILQPPQLRGALGETMLEQLLAQILPKEHYIMQYTFKNRERVDAVIRIGDWLVPVDAKFPLEGFRRMLDEADEARRQEARRSFARAVKARVDEIAGKYILPDEGTFDFALMYIPAENVYYEVIVKDEPGDSLAAYALKRKVIPVSPCSFYAYLQAIVLGLKGLQIERNAQEILGLLGRLTGDLQRFRESFEVIGRHLTHAKNRYDEAASALARFEARLEGISRYPERPALSGQEDAQA